MSIKNIIGLMWLVGITGCSGDAGGDETTVPQESPSAITFSSGLAEAETVTRVTGLEEKTNTFRVWGYKNNTSYVDGYQTVIDGYTVTWQVNSAATTLTNSDGWEYVTGTQTIKYWDWSAAAYRFFGLVGSWTDATHKAAYSAYEPYKAYESSVNVNDQATMPYFSRLWYSTGQLPDYADKQFGRPVRLEFVQSYTRVRFMFTFSTPDDAVATVLSEKSFKPTDDTKKIYQRGKFAIHYPVTGNGAKATAKPAEWWDVSDRDGVLAAMTQDYFEEPADDANARTWYGVLPAKREDQGTYTLSVKVNGEPKTAVVPEAYMQWEPGYEYTYIFKITEAGGVELETVQSAFKEWTDGGSGDHSIYNW